MVAIDAGTSTPPPNVSASPVQTTVGKTDSQDTLTKADKLEIAYVRDAVAAGPAPPVMKTPDETPAQPAGPTATAKIVSRAWHDPNARKSAAAFPRRRIKDQEPKTSKQEPKTSKNVDRAKPTVDLRACRRPEGFAGLLRALNLSPGCDT
jgi:hypothetical protein